MFVGHTLRANDAVTRGIGAVKRGQRLLKMWSVEIGTVSFDGQLRFSASARERTCMTASGVGIWMRGRLYQTMPIL